MSLLLLAVSASLWRMHALSHTDEFSIGNESRQLSGQKALILPFRDINLCNIALVGKENALLGEVAYCSLHDRVDIPIGFATTIYAYRNFIEYLGLDTKLNEILSDLNGEDIQDLQRCSRKAHALILESTISPRLAEEIEVVSKELSEHYIVEQEYYGETIFLFRSNIISDVFNNYTNFFDLPQDVYRNTSSLQKDIEDFLKSCVASLFTDKAISIQCREDLSYLDVAVSISILKINFSDLSDFGEIFSIDPLTGFSSTVVVTANKNFTKTTNKGDLKSNDSEDLTSDEFFVFKPTLKNKFRCLLAKKTSRKENFLPLLIESEQQPSISDSKSNILDNEILDDEILDLAECICMIENSYSQLQNTDLSVESIQMEWCKNRKTGKLMIVKAYLAPQSSQSDHVLHSYRLSEKNNNVLAKGHAIGDKIGQGKVRVVLDFSNIHEFYPGEVLVTNRTDPDWRPFMQVASAIVTRQGGRTCHSAISAREMGIPTIVGCHNAIDELWTGQEVTISCAEGEEGKVYAGLIPFEIDETPLDSLPQTKTQILINIADPEEAFNLASLPCDGVGVARTEYIIANEVKIHPLALVHFDKLDDDDVKYEISQLTLSYKHKPDYFVEKMTQGVGMIAAAFYPKPVIVRMSDFKSNEYANLIGGKQFEPKEENPMIGWRGASRYYDEKYRDAYHLECKVIKKVRDEIGLTNVIPLIPFCRTPEEGRKVLAEMASQGLEQGVNGLQIYVMCETPLNVLLAEQFAEIFDGFSIGTNDLTQLIIGIDRDSELIDHLFDERNDGVKEMIKLVVEKAKKHNRKIGICGQAPTDYPEFIPFLVDLGIDSISLNSDVNSVIKTRMAVFKAENNKTSKETSETE